MSKWTQKLRRGGTRAFGSLPEPGTGDWSWTPDGATYITATRLVDIPAGADLWNVRWKEYGTDPWTESVTTSAASILVGPLTTGHNYLAAIAWWKGTVRVSEYSTPKVATAP